jgi:UDP-glucose 4-epimerase
MFKKAITIGAGGYLGSHLANMLKDYGIYNEMYSIKSSHLIDNKNMIPLDVTNRQDFDVLPKDADVLFYFAGLTKTEAGFSNYDQYIQTNEIGLLHLLDWMRQNQSTARLIFPSSRLVYKGKTNIFLTEESEKTANTLYALNKLSGEYLLDMYQRAFNIEYTVFRICVPYGNQLSHHYSHGTIGFMLEKAKKGSPIPVYGTGEGRRTFTHVQDICRNIVLGAASPRTKNSIFNIGGQPFSLIEVANMIAQRFGVDIAYVNWPELAEKIESGDTLFDDTKLKKAGLGQYQHTFQEWIQSIKMNNPG